MLAFKVLFEGLGIRHLCLIKERNLTLRTVQELKNTTKPVPPSPFCFLFPQANCLLKDTALVTEAPFIQLQLKRLFNLRFSKRCF